MNKVITILITLLFTQTTFAQFSGEGAGTESNPYRICNAIQLDQIRNFEGSGVVFELMNDIDIYDYLQENTGIYGWQPIPLFKGVLKGNNHVIKGLYVNTKERVAFFDLIQYATIKDLGLEYTKVSSYGGALLCHKAEKSTIEGCFIKAQKIYCQGENSYGGLIDLCYSSSLKYNALLFDSIIMSSNNSVGGLCNKLCSSNCIGNSVKGDVICRTYKANISWFVGGLIGEVDYDPTLSNCPDIMICDNKFEGKVVGQCDVGGLVGRIDNNSTTKDYKCTITRNLIIGNVLGEQSKAIGGLCGWSMMGVHTNNVLINDTILGNTYSGYLCGFYGSSNHTVSNNRRLATTKKIGGYVGGSFKFQEPSTVGPSVLKIQDTYSGLGWDFENTWSINEGEAYPFLQAESKFGLVSSISLNEQSVELMVGKCRTISATIQPVTASNKELLWSSSDETIVKVKNGTITAISVGHAIITASSTDGSNISAQCNVTVTESNSENIIPSDMSSIKNTVYASSFTIRAGNQFTMPVNVKSEEENISGFQFDIVLPQGVTIDKNSRGTAYAVTFDAASGRTSTEYHSIVSGDQPDGSIRILCSSNSAELILGSDGTVLNIPLTISDVIESGDYPIYFRNIVLSTVDAERITSEDITMIMTIPSFTLGDVNGDDYIDVADITATASHIVGRTPSSFIEAAADVNSDTHVDVADITLIAKAIVGTTTLSAKKMFKTNKQPSGYVNTTVDALPFHISPSTSSQLLKIHLNNPSVEISGIQFDLYLPEGITVDKNKRGTAYDYAFDSESNRTDATYHSVVSGDQPDGAIRFLCSSNSAEIILGNSGPVFNIKLSASADMPAGIYTFEMKNIVVSTGDAERLTPIDYKGTIIVGEPNLSGNIKINGRYEDLSIINSIASNKYVTSLDLVDVVSIPENSVVETANKNALLFLNDKLSMQNRSNVIINGVCNKLIITDGNNFASPVSFNVLSASYYRPMTNNWETICLPFEVTMDDAGKYEFFELADFDGETLTVNKVYGTLAAGTPSLVLCAENETEIDIIQGNTNIVADTQEGSSCNALTLRGTLQETTLNDDGYILINNKFWWIDDLRNAGNTIILAPFRAWIESKSANMVKSFGVSIWNDPTAVEVVKALIEGNVEYYDINGCRTHKKHKGVNIVKTKNGKTIKIIH